MNENLETSEPISNDELTSNGGGVEFGYKQDIGGLIYHMVTCRPDTSYPIIKLRQYSTKQSRIHVETVCGIYQYLKDTIDKDIYYWRKNIRNDYPETPNPTTLTYYTNYIPHGSKTKHDPIILNIKVDVSYNADINHC